MLAWLIARLLGSAVFALGVLTQPWAHWMRHPWWWACAAATSGLWAAHSALRGRIGWTVWQFGCFVAAAVVLHLMLDEYRRARERVNSDA